MLLFVQVLKSRVPGNRRSAFATLAEPPMSVVNAALQRKRHF
jgi:hypothetical protein